MTTVVNILDIPHIRRRPSMFRITHPVGLTRISPTELTENTDFLNHESY